MSSADRCRKKIIDAAGGKMTPQEADEIMADIIRNKDAYEAANGLLSKEDFADLQKRNLIQAKKTATKERLNRLKNYKIKEETKLKLADNVDNPVRVFRGIFSDIANDQINMRVQASLLFLNNLRKEGVKDFYDNHLFPDEVGIEKAYINSQPRGTDGKIILPEKSKTGNEGAFKVAKVMSDNDEYMRQLYNDEGADIGAVDEFIASQAYDPEKIASVDREEFMNDFLKTFTNEKTMKEYFNGREPDEDALNDLYDTFVSGVHAQDSGVKNFVFDKETGQTIETKAMVDPLSAFKGPANVAKQVSRHRKLHANPEHFNEFFTKYGWGDVYTAQEMAQTKFGNNIAQMKALGTNPEAMVKTIVDEFEFENRGNISKGGLAKIKSSEIQNMLDQITGKGNVMEATPQGNMNIVISDSLLALNRANMLQSVALSSVGDAGWMAKEITAMEGSNGFSSFAKVFKENAQAFADAFDDETRGIMDDLLDEISDFTRTAADRLQFTGSNGTRVTDSMAMRPSEFIEKIGHRGVREWLRDTRNTAGEAWKRTIDEQQRFGLKRSIRSAINGVADVTMEAGFLPHWDRVKRATISTRLSKTLGRYADRSFDKLPTSFKEYLTDYKLNDFWDDLRGFAATTEQGTKFFSTSKLQEDITDDFFLAKNPNLSKVELRRAKTDLILKFQRAMRNVRDRAVPTSDKLQRAITMTGLKRGNLVSELMIHIIQYKQFPMTIMEKQMFRDLQNGKGAKGLLQLMLYGFAGGMLGVLAQDLAKGKIPDYSKPQTYWRAITMGGGLGLMADAIQVGGGFGVQVSTDLAKFIAGPTLGSSVQIGESFNDMVAGVVEQDSKKFFAKPTKNLLNMVPFTKLPYTRAAWNFLFFDTIMKGIDPKYGKAQDNIDKRMGRIPISDALDLPENIGELVTGDF